MAWNGRRGPVAPVAGFFHAAEWQLDLPCFHLSCNANRARGIPSPHGSQSTKLTCVISKSSLLKPIECGLSDFASPRLNVQKVAKTFGDMAICAMKNSRADEQFRGH